MARDVPRLFNEIVDLVRSSSGELNFNDALIALSCYEREITAVASFDADFDRVPWLMRLARPEDVSQHEKL
jgi:predicted nucleic acid-binding protein